MTRCPQHPRDAGGGHRLHALRWVHGWFPVRHGGGRGRDRGCARRHGPRTKGARRRNPGERAGHRALGAGWAAGRLHDAARRRAGHAVRSSRGAVGHGAPWRRHRRRRWRPGARGGCRRGRVRGRGGGPAGDLDRPRRWHPHHLRACRRGGRGRGRRRDRAAYRHVDRGRFALLAGRVPALGCAGGRGLHRPAVAADGGGDPAVPRGGALRRAGAPERTPRGAARS